MICFLKDNADLWAEVDSKNQKSLETISKSPIWHELHEIKTAKMALKPSLENKGTEPNVPIGAPRSPCTCHTLGICGDEECPQAQP